MKECNRRELQQERSKCLILETCVMQNLPHLLHFSVRVNPPVKIAK